MFVHFPECVKSACVPVPLFRYGGGFSCVGVYFVVFDVVFQKGIVYCLSIVHLQHQSSFHHPDRVRCGGGDCTGRNCTDKVADVLVVGKVRVELFEVFVAGEVDHPCWEVAQCDRHDTSVQASDTFLVPYQAHRLERTFVLRGDVAVAGVASQICSLRLESSFRNVQGAHHQARQEPCQRTRRRRDFVRTHSQPERQEVLCVCRKRFTHRHRVDCNVVGDLVCFRYFAGLIVGCMVFLAAGVAAAVAFVGHVLLWLCCFDLCQCFSSSELQLPQMQAACWGGKGQSGFSASRMQEPSCTMCLHGGIDLGIDDVCRHVDTGVERNPGLLMLSETTVLALDGKGRRGRQGGLCYAVRCGAVLEYFYRNPNCSHTSLRWRLTYRIQNFTGHQRPPFRSSSRPSSRPGRHPVSVTMRTPPSAWRWQWQASSSAERKGASAIAESGNGSEPVGPERI